MRSSGSGFQAETPDRFAVEHCMYSSRCTFPHTRLNTSPVIESHDHSDWCVQELHLAGDVKGDSRSKAPTTKNKIAKNMLQVEVVPKESRIR